MRSNLLNFLPLGFLAFLVLAFVLGKSDLTTNKPAEQTLGSTSTQKQKGAHVFGYLDSANLPILQAYNINWITMVSYGSQKDFDSPEMRFRQGDSLQRIQRALNWKSQIELAHAAGYKVFLKPHLWINEPSDGKWRSDVYPTNEANWVLWQKSYRAFIMQYAKIAADNQVELFCIGTEFTRLALKKNEFWEELILEIRAVYSGEITYAANWYQEYEDITFWDQLDYIGVQAYFPLVKNKNPSIDEISKGWNQYLPALKSVSKKYKKKILFTELGYKSTADAAIEPWQWIEYGTVQKLQLSYETQANCYQAFFDKLWTKDWFAGMHLWSLRIDYDVMQGKDNLDFTPRGKPAEEVIAKGFDFPKKMNQ